MMPRDLTSYRRGWETARLRQKLAHKNRYAKAITHARLAGEHLKHKYGCRVFLFGSITDQNRFMEHSDIDMAISCLATPEDFWVLYSEVMGILHPFDFDLIELERIEPDVRAHVLQKGVEL